MPIIQISPVKVVVIILVLVVIRVWVKAAMAWSYGDCMHSFFSSKVDLQPMRCRERLRSLWSCSKFWSPESWQIPISRIASQVARVFRGGSNFGWYIKISLIMIFVLCIATIRGIDVGWSPKEKALLVAVTTVRVSYHLVYLQAVPHLITLTPH